MNLSIEKEILIINKCRTCMSDKIDDDLTIFELKELNNEFVQLSDMLSVLTGLKVCIQL